ncbi:MAG: hypothetical protein AB7I38_17250 [Dehalococcoidia bacterium]
MAIWRRRFLLSDLLLALAATLAFAIWVYAAGGDQTVDCLLNGNRAILYATLAGIFGALLGFAITAFTIVLGLSSHPHLSVVFGSRRASDLWESFPKAIRGTGVATIAAVIALLADRDTSPETWAQVLVVFGSCLAAVRLARVGWILERLVSLVSGPRPHD